MKLIVGLGNPGKSYERTRHNTGFMIIDNYLKDKGLTNSKKQFNGEYFEVIKDVEKIIFLKPQNYINLSGEVIKKYIDYYKIPITNILIIHDDLDIPIGKYKLRKNGGSAGHNGLKNIEECFHTQEYKRLRVGISNDKNIDTKDYVLGKFSQDEQSEINSVIEISAQIIDDFILIDFDKLMNKYNKK